MIDVLKYIMCETGRKGAERMTMKEFPVIEKVDVDVEKIGDKVDGVENGALCTVHVLQKRNF